MTRLLLLALIAAVAAPSASTQDAQPLFVYREATAGVAAQGLQGERRAIVSRTRVGMRIETLFGATGGARRVLLNTGPSTWTAVVERVDTDATGFRSWVGALEGVPESHVVFTERDGIVSGLINAVGTTYQVRTEGPGTYVLELVDVTSLGEERDPIDNASGSAAHSGVAADLVGDDASTIDVLMLYTPTAREVRGGTAQIQSLVSQIISDTNTAFARSGISPRARLVAAVELPLQESWTMASDLFALSGSPAAQLLREAARADLVQLLVSSPDLNTCGIGYLLTLNSTDLSAYSVADVACAAQYTPTHEMAHNMGSHHAPEDRASGALFPYSYGFKDRVRGFRTVMAYGCPGVPCHRILNFSNPAVTHQDSPTGSTVQDNARSIQAAALTVANFKRSAPSAPRDVPAAPAGLRSSVTGNAVTVAWDVTPESKAVVLQVGTAPGAADILSRAVSGIRSASGTVVAGTYFWRMFAVNEAGPSAPSAERQFTVGTPCLVPTAPRELGFSIADAFVTLTWVPPGSGSTPLTYVVEAGSAVGAADMLVAPAGPATSVGTAVSPGTYFVRVRAQNICGTGPPSNEQVITVQ